MNFLDKMYPPGGVSPFKNNGALRSGVVGTPPKTSLGTVRRPPDDSSNLCPPKTFAI